MSLFVIALTVASLIMLVVASYVVAQGALMTHAT
jgi:hypothetical protein